MSRFGLAVVAGILVAAGLVAGFAYRYGLTGEAPQGGQPEAPVAGGSGGEGGQGGGPPEGRGPRGGAGGEAGGGSGLFNVSGEAAAACRSAGENNESIGQNIKWLLDNHDVFNYTLEVFEDNRTIIWVVTAPSHDALVTLVSHIEQMECVIENGGNPRPFDPLFQVDAEITGEYVETTITWINDTAVRIVKVAENDCAFEVIKLHAEVVKGFFDTGRVEASKTHEVPEDVASICQPYLEGQGAS